MYACGKTFSQSITNRIKSEEFQGRHPFGFIGFISMSEQFAVILSGIALITICGSIINCLRFTTGKSADKFRCRTPRNLAQRRCARIVEHVVKRQKFAQCFRPECNIRVPLRVFFSASGFQRFVQLRIVRSTRHQKGRKNRCHIDRLSADVHNRRNACRTAGKQACRCHIKTRCRCVISHLCKVPIRSGNIHPIRGILCKPFALISARKAGALSPYVVKTILIVSPIICAGLVVQPLSEALKKPNIVQLFTRANDHVQNALRHRFKEHSRMFKEPRVCQPFLLLFGFVFQIIFSDIQIIQIIHCRAAVKRRAVIVKIAEFFPFGILHVRDCIQDIAVISTHSIAQLRGSEFQLFPHVGVVAELNPVIDQGIRRHVPILVGGKRAAVFRSIGSRAGFKPHIS